MSVIVEKNSHIVISLLELYVNSFDSKKYAYELNLGWILWTITGKQKFRWVVEIQNGGIYKVYCLKNKFRI